ncbi:RNA polymerase-binding protein DksA [Rhodanobacter sp. L36]|uniref:RNA polymerase-binding protein DksA n=1 Tax=Rhodanobacter sp. L36 TaxID=1747221 RepID=UPI0020B109C7|nr:RNA polymerase-binding protein DksA [Rhodanobacter sp. L36]
MKAAPVKAALSKSAPAPVEAVKSPAPSSSARLFKGKVASATAMVTPREAPASARASSNNNQKNSSSSMNKLATKTLDNGVTREDDRYALPSTSIINLPKGYHPSNNEEYMNPQHLAYFRNKLRDWRDQLVEESRQTMDNLREEVRDVGDEAERATRETENSLELRTRDRYRKLISKIDKALRRIEEGSYGFCEETDEEIGVDRLDARPIATLSLDAQERREHLQKQMGD